MVTKILTNLSVAKKNSKKGGVVYRSPRIYLPTKLTDDSSFPFLEGDELLIRIQDQRLLIERSGGQAKGSARGRSAKNKAHVKHGLREPKRTSLKKLGRHVLKRVRGRTMR